MSGGFSAFLDIAVLILLGVTVFYAAKLSIYLRDFREGREDMEALMRTLAESVNKAQTSMERTRITAQETAQGLEELVKESKFLSDELRFMNEAGDNLANRLEKLAERNSQAVVAKSEPMHFIEEYEEEEFYEDIAPRPEEKTMFSIRDPEFEVVPPGEESAPERPLQSRAERELLEALKHSVHKTRRMKARGTA